MKINNLLKEFYESMAKSPNKMQNKMNDLNDDIRSGNVSQEDILKGMKELEGMDEEVEYYEGFL